MRRNDLRKLQFLPIMALSIGAVRIQPLRIRVFLCHLNGGKKSSLRNIFFERNQGHMKQFLCNRLRMYTYLVDRGFSPAQVLPDADNPRYKMFLFDETPELTAAVMQYFSTDCLTARMNNERNRNYETSEKHPRI